MDPLEIRGGLHRDMWRLFGAEAAFAGLGLAFVLIGLVDLVSGSADPIYLVFALVGLVFLVLAGYQATSKRDRLSYDGVQLRLDLTGVYVAYGDRGEDLMAHTTWDNIAAVVVRNLPSFTDRTTGECVEFVPLKADLVDGDPSRVAEAARSLGVGSAVALLTWGVTKHHGLSPDPVMAWLRQNQPGVRLEDRRGG